MALAEVEVEEPRREAELLLCEAAGISATTLFAWPERELPDAAVERFEDMLARRGRGEPVAHILGRRAFWTLDLQVTAATLIPRPETEFLVELALSHLPGDQPLRIADLGTGTGAIACALASERHDWRLLAIERASEAARIACRNAQEAGLDNVQIVIADWLDAIAPESLDAIVTNPPYIAASDPHLHRGDLRFEPSSALAAGADGLDDIRAIVAAAPNRLSPGGFFATEHGFDQGAAVRELLAGHGFNAVETHRDLAGHERVTLGLTP